jgi:hypothetical protein
MKMGYGTWYMEGRDIVNMVWLGLELILPSPLCLMWLDSRVQPALLYCDVYERRLAMFCFSSKQIESSFFKY